MERQDAVTAQRRDLVDERLAEARDVGELAAVDERAGDVGLREAVLEQFVAQAKEVEKTAADNDDGQGDLPRAITMPRRMYLESLPGRMRSGILSAV